MNRTIIIIASIILSTLTNASGQDILRDYYQGNKDRMAADAATLINGPEPVFKSAPPSAAKALEGKRAKPEQAYQYKNHSFTVRDGKKIFAYRFAKRSPDTVVLLHGVKSTAFDYLKAARLLQDAT